MSRKNKKRIQGSISIFLTIILVPMIALSGLIVDASRVQLAKSMVSSTGDLTMNSGLANYDTVLKDVYGLFAISQNDEDLQANLQKYFEDTLISNGVIENEEDIQTNPLLKDISAAFSGKASNLMNMEVENFTAERVPNSDLAQPYMLKNQIIEFEKYRAPVNTALSLLDSVAAFSKFSKQSEVTKQKVTVDEKTEDFNEACKKLYKKLKQYDDKLKGNPPVPGKTYGYNGTEWEKDFNGYGNTYKEINRVVVELMPDIPQPKAYVKKRGSGREYPYYLEGSVDVSITSGDFDDLKDDIDDILDDITGSDFGRNVVGKLVNYQRRISSLQLSERVNYLVLYEKYMDKIGALEEYYEAFRDAYDDEDADEQEDDEDTYDDMLQEMMPIMGDAYDVSNGAKTNMDAINNAKTNASSKAKAVKDSVVAYESWLSDTLSMLDEIPGLIANVKAKADEVQAANNNLQGSIDNYTKGKSDSFSDGMQQEHDYNSKAFDLSAITGLEDQITAHTAFLKSVDTAFKAFKYGNKSISDIDSFDGAKSALGDYKTTIENDFNSNPQSINDAYADSIFNNAFIKQDSYPVQNKPSSYVAELGGGFWVYLQQAFGGTETSSEDDNAKNTIIDKAAGEQEETTKNVEALPDVDVSFVDLPSGQPTAMGSGIDKLNVDKKTNKGFTSLLDKMSSAVASILNGIEQAMEAGRDNLYVVDYNFSMFSFYTQEKEFKVQHPDEEMALKTSTGVSINETNNSMYKSEIEYILYGHQSREDNVKNAKENIFALRFVANACYALTNAEIKGITLPPALSIQAASGGIIPYKLPQVVMQLCLALAESGMDLKKMEDGQKVAIVKTRDTWVMSPIGGANAIKDYATKMGTEAISNGADALTGALNKLIDNAGEKVQIRTDELINDVRVAANAKANEAVGNIFNMFSDEIVASLDQVLQQGKNISKSANQETDEIIDGALKEIQDYINNTPDGIVKTLMQQYFDSNIKQIANDIRNKINDAISKINSEDISAGNLIRAAQKAVSDQIATVLNGLADDISEKMKSTISNFGDKLKAQVGDKIDTASKALTEKAVSMTDEFFDKNFSKISEKMPKVAGQAGKNNSLASILVFGYSDYLKMFMFLKLCVNDEDTLKRTADVIQINVGKEFVDDNGGVLYEHKKGSDFRMSKANSYVEITATARLKTMFLSLPLITKYSGKSGDYFTIKYKSAIGY